MKQQPIIVFPTRDEQQSVDEMSTYEHLDESGQAALDQLYDWLYHRGLERLRAREGQSQKATRIC